MSQDHKELNNNYIRMAYSRRSDEDVHNFPADHNRSLRLIQVSKDFNTAAKFTLIGIVVNSFLQSLADALIAPNSNGKIVFWLGVLALIFPFFAFLNWILSKVEHYFVDPILDEYEEAKQKRLQIALRNAPKQTIRFDELKTPKH
jgi:hypothetical protein